MICINTLMKVLLLSTWFLVTVSSKSCVQKPKPWRKLCKPYKKLSMSGLRFKDNGVTWRTFSREAQSSNNFLMNLNFSTKLTKLSKLPTRKLIVIQLPWDSARATLILLIFLRNSTLIWKESIKNWTLTSKKRDVFSQDSISCLKMIWFKSCLTLTELILSPST